MKRLVDFPASDRKRMLKDFFKFTFVRNPFERLLSAYKDKGFETYFPYKVMINSEILNTLIQK